MNNIKITMSQMESDLKKLGYSDLMANVNSEKALKCVADGFEEMRKYVVQNNFPSDQDEIQFFKLIRPQVASRISLITFVIEYRHTCSISENMRADLINHRMNDYKLVMTENRNYVIRMNRGIGEEDLKYFIRNQFTVPVNSLGREVLHDPSFSTFHSLLLEKIITNELIENFLNRTSEESVHQPSTLTWTANKTALIELVYALHYSQAVNGGELGIKLLAELFEEIFNISLGNVYRAFHEIKNRNEPTLFIDFLKEELLNKVYSDDSFHPD